MPPKRSALILDDDPALRALMGDVLTDEGWDVRSAARNDAGLHIASLSAPDLVLLDVSQPEYAPEAVATGLRIHFGPTLPILAMATTPQPELVRRIGAYDFLLKPFELSHLLKLMDHGNELILRSARLRSHSDQALSRIRHLRLLGPFDT
jgi:two-component system NtrC family response regulator